MRVWSVRPCVRPVGAAHEKPLAMMPFAKPGPDRRHALDGATAKCGFSKLRVSTPCASLHVRPSQTDLRSRRLCRERFAVSRSAGHDRPDRTSGFVGQGHGRNLRLAARHQIHKPWPPRAVKTDAPSSVARCDTPSATWRPLPELRLHQRVRMRRQPLSIHSCLCRIPTTACAANLCAGETTRGTRLRRARRATNGANREREMVAKARHRPDRCLQRWPIRAAPIQIIPGQPKPNQCCRSGPRPPTRQQLARGSSYKGGSRRVAPPAPFLTSSEI